MSGLENNLLAPGDALHSQRGTRRSGRLLRLCATVLAACTCLPLALPAPEAPCLRRSVPVNVIDREGNQVWGLTPADFRAEFRGQPVKILSATLDTGPRRVVVVLDASGSMTASKRKWNLARTIATDIVARAPKEFTFGTIVFAGEVLQEVDFEEGREAVARSLLELPVERSGFGKADLRTAVRDAFARAVGLFGEARSGDAVYLISDGGENSSREGNRRVKTMLLAGGVRLFLFFIQAVGQDSSSPHFEVGPRELGDLMKVTGGTYLVFPALNLVSRSARDWTDSVYEPSPKEEARLGLALDSLYARMAQFYLLRVELPRAVDKPRQWRLEVVDAQGNKRKDLSVLYPRELLPCQAEGEKEKLENGK